MRGLSVCMIALNEERFILGALQSVRTIADEIVLGIDSRSRDGTEAAGRLIGARIHRFEWEDSFAAARNVGLAKAKRDWILILDPDERVTPWMQAMVEEIMRAPRTDVEGYAFRSLHVSLDGRKRADDGKLSIRLFRNNPHTRYVNRIHEQLRHKGKPLSIGAMRADIGLLHYGFDPDVYAARGKRMRNMNLLAKALAENPDDRYLTYKLAQQYERDGNLDMAASVAKRALDMPGELISSVIEELEALAA